MKDITMSNLSSESLTNNSSLADYYNSLKTYGKTTPFEAVRTLEALCKLKSNKQLLDLIANKEE